MSKLLHSILAGVLLLTGLATQARAAKRVALVIGNADYQHERSLPNALLDVDSLGRALKGFGFDVTQRTNLATKSQFEKAIDEIRAPLRKGDVCLVYYSGHGLQLDDVNYLLPTGAEVTAAHHVKDRCVRVNYILDALHYTETSLKIVVIDACRNAPSFQKGKSGFARLPAAPDGTMVFFATEPGTFALAGEPGKGSPFARHLVTRMQSDADRLPIRDIFYDTSRDVKRATGGRQKPTLVMDASMDRFSLTTHEDTITNLTGMQLKLIPAGTFMMGSSLSPDEVEERFKGYGAKASYFTDEHPQHQVRISKPFYLGMHEVTVGQFRQFVTATGYKTEPETDGEGGKGWNESAGKFESRDPKYTWRNAGFPQSDSHPVVNVTWNDATAFCEWLSREQNRVYRVPSEAEWEYACRGGTTGSFWNGSDPARLAEIANVTDGTAKKKFTGWTAIQSDDGYVFSAPVGRFPANRFGLHDMHGNVWEWCSDWYDEDYYASSPGIDPRGPSSGSSRVLRGGSWFSGPGYVRSAYRDRDTPGYRDSNGGFRVLCESD